MHHRPASCNLSSCWSTHWLLEHSLAGEPQSPWAPICTHFSWRLKRTLSTGCRRSLRERTVCKRPHTHTHMCVCHKNGTGFASQSKGGHRDNSMSSLHGRDARLYSISRGLPGGTLLFLVLLGWLGEWTWPLSVLQSECFGVLSGPAVPLQYTLADVSQDCAVRF